MGPLALLAFVLRAMEEERARAKVTRFFTRRKKKARAPACHRSKSVACVGHPPVFPPPSGSSNAAGAKNVIVTLGSRGSMLVSSKSEGFRIFPAQKVAAVDTVGAGDAFMGSLGAYLARGVALDEAIEKAVRCARAARDPRRATARVRPSERDRLAEWSASRTMREPGLISREFVSWKRPLSKNLTYVAVDGRFVYPGSSRAGRCVRG